MKRDRPQGQACPSAPLHRSKAVRRPERLASVQSKSYSQPDLEAASNKLFLRLQENTIRQHSCSSTFSSAP
jgi:hypothetical protein